MSDDRLKIAVFIDFDNIEIGVKTTLSSYFDIGAVLEAIKERGEIVTKVAYGDWTRAGDYGRAMSQHAVHMVQRNLTPGGDKNGADINLALDALEMAFTHNHINSFVIVSGDSDFISLVEKLKQYDRKVFVVGGRAFTSVVMQKNCTEFIAYENLVGRRAPDRARSGAGESNLPQAMPLVRRALKLLADREVVPQLGLLKSTLLQLDSAFSEREYGASTFRDFVQKLAKAGFVTLKGSERSFHVELREAAEAHAAPAAGHRESAAHPASHAATPAPTNGASRARTPEDEEAPAVEGPPAETRLSQAEGYHLIQQAVLRANVPRWPLYVRQVKQLVRALDAQFDERRYGFASLIEALKFSQREGLVRVERDRQGIVRVWPGPQLQKAPGLPVEPEDSAAPIDADVEVAETTSPGAVTGRDRESPSAFELTSPSDFGSPEEPFEPAEDPEEAPIALDEVALPDERSAPVAGERAVDVAPENVEGELVREEDTGPEPARTLPRRRTTTRTATRARKPSGTRKASAEPRAPRNRSRKPTNTGE